MQNNEAHHVWHFKIVFPFHSRSIANKGTYDEKKSQ